MYGIYAYIILYILTPQTTLLDRQSAVPWVAFGIYITNRNITYTTWSNRAPGLRQELEDYYGIKVFHTSLSRTLSPDGWQSEPDPQSELRKLAHLHVVQLGDRGRPWMSLFLTNP